MIDSLTDALASFGTRTGPLIVRASVSEKSGTPISRLTASG